jgi:hypothetical protein
MVIRVSVDIGYVRPLRFNVNDRDQRQAWIAHLRKQAMQRSLVDRGAMK